MVNEIVAVFVKPLETPLTVTVEVPVVAVLLAVSVNELVFDVLAGLNDAVTPLGNPVADRLTLPVKPFCGEIVTVLVLLVPCVIVKVFGDAERVKVGGGFTVKEMVAAADRPLDEPVTVTVTVPVAAVLLAVSVNVLVFAVLLGLNDAVTPLGSPDADRLTLLLKPFCGVTVMLLVALFPCAIVKLFGDVERVKFPWGFTVRESVVVFVRLPEEPVTVTVTVPVAAEPVADKVSMLLVVAGFVPNTALTPFGRPDAVRFTFPLKPFKGLIAMVVEEAVPWTNIKLVGDAERVKVGCDEDVDQLLTRLAALTVPIPVAKSHPILVP